MKGILNKAVLTEVLNFNYPDVIVRYMAR